MKTGRPVQNDRSCEGQALSGTTRVRPVSMLATPPAHCTVVAWDKRRLYMQGCGGVQQSGFNTVQEQSADGAHAGRSSPMV